MSVMAADEFFVVKLVAMSVAMLLALVVIVIYLTYIERKVISFMQGRIGPRRVGPYGLFQPFADMLKLLNKELIFPDIAYKTCFILAPIIIFTTALLAWAAIPWQNGVVLADLNAGLLYVLAVSSAGVYGIILAGWSANSKYALLGSLRAAAQTISYEIAMGLSLLGVMMLAGSLNFQDIVLAQSGGISHWYFLPLFPLFIIFWASGVAETNRAPFDVAEGESELVAGFHVEYSGVMFALFFFAEYVNMVLIAALLALMFCGGWLSPFQGIASLESLFSWCPGAVWLLLKISMFVFFYLWFRATLPRFRYDQIMRLGWQVFIPVSLLWLVVVAIGICAKLI